MRFLAAVALLLFFGVSALFVFNFAWLNQYNWVSTFVLSLVLLITTFAYMIHSNEILKNAQKQVEEVHRQVNATQAQLQLEYIPNLVCVFGRKPDYIYIYGMSNLGRYPVFVTQVRLRLSDGQILEESPMLVIGPNAQRAFRSEYSKVIAQTLALSTTTERTLRMNVHFLYGPTGQTEFIARHAVHVNARGEMQTNITGIGKIKRHVPSHTVVEE